MAITNNYYIDGPSLASATAVFTNSDLTIKADDGWYSFEGIVRQQLDGILLAQQDCPSCNTSCDNTINANGSQGVYLLDVELGSGVGAILVKFNPDLVPDGIRILFNGEVYNKMSSSFDGLHESTNTNNFTYVGLSSLDCGISGTTYSNVLEYSYNGVEFLPTGNVRNITASPGDVSLSFSAPGDLLLVIPKLTASPSLLNIEVFGPCSGTAWTVSIDCPVLLNGFSSSVLANSSEEACALAETVTYYNASVVNTPNTVSLYDFVFVDAYGSVPLNDGYYKASELSGGNNWFRVQNGIITELGSCAPVVCNNYKVTNNTPSPLYFSSVNCSGIPLQDTLVPPNNGVVYTGCLSLITDSSGLLNIEIYTPNCGSL